MTKLELVYADHFVDLPEADGRAGTYKLHYGIDGDEPWKLTAHCPCGCGSVKSFLLEPHRDQFHKTWFLSGPFGRHSLYPAVVFAQVGRKSHPKHPHWKGWLLDGKWVRADSPHLQLANPQLNMLPSESPVRGEAAAVSYPTFFDDAARVAGGAAHGTPA